MFKVKKTKIISKSRKKYLSFPDIVKSPYIDGRFFLVFREGDSHHPTWSNLILMRSDNNGRTWKKQHKFHTNIEKDGYVWNCPRLSYVDDILYITCDQKSSTFEKTAHFKTVHLTSKTEGEFFRLQETGFPGMVPDKIIPFKEKLFCANHKVKNTRNHLIQLVSWSRDNGRLWYDTNIMAHSDTKQFCEASVVNMGDYLIAYLRDNSGHKRNIYTVKSFDGINWSEPKKLPVFGQRVTAIKEREGVIGAYRNSDKVYSMGTFTKPPKNICYVSIFEHDVITGEITISHIDEEYASNQYHFGYTGIAKVSDNSYLVVYYIKQDAPWPYIKLAFVEKTKE